MAAFFTLTLDTTAPSGGKITLITLTNTRSITATLAATGATQMKLWGDIGTGSAATTEAAASWETFTESKAIQLTSGDGVKTVYVKFRDDVGNETTSYSATTDLDTTAAIVTVTGPDVAKVSKVAGYNVATFSFSSDTDFVEYSVRVVPQNSSTHTAGTQIGTTNGSENMSGTGDFKADTAISCKINAADLAAASAGDGAKIIKVFVKDKAGNWSV